MTGEPKKPSNPVKSVTLVGLGVVLVGFGLTLMNVRDNIAAFAGLVLVVGGIGLAATTVYSVLKEKNDQ